MERFSNKIESSESERKDWKVLEALSVEQAEQLIATEIPNLESLTEDEQIASLRALEESLTSNNENRFVAKEVARRYRVLEEIRRHRGEMARYGITI